MKRTPNEREEHGHNEKHTETTRGTERGQEEQGANEMNRKKTK
jgi:hypothetical protein